MIESSNRFRNCRWRLGKVALHFYAFLESFYNHQYCKRYYLLPPSSSSSSYYHHQSNHHHLRQWLALHVSNFDRLSSMITNRIYIECTHCINRVSDYGRTSRSGVESTKKTNNAGQHNAERVNKKQQQENTLSAADVVPHINNRRLWTIWLKWNVTNARI